MLEFRNSSISNEIALNREFNLDSFSDGQISSKIWLCEVLENYFKRNKQPLHVVVYGSWQGVLPFLLLSRNILKIKRLDLYDIDSSSQDIAKKVLDRWHFQKKIIINHYSLDCNTVKWSVDIPNLIINTSCEHITDLDWWINIPNKTIFCLQSTDMKHPTHINIVHSLKEWKKSLNISFPVIYEGELFTKYETFAFHRWMIVGKKSDSSSSWKKIKHLLITKIGGAAYR